MSDEAHAFNPFPGLRPFTAEEAHLFFGRDESSDELLRRLRQHRFLAVVGPSGSGKSSLVQAGLLPGLHGGLMAEEGSAWRVATLRPGSDPIGNLARALVDSDLEASEAGETDETGGPMPARLLVETVLRRGSLGLVDAARRAGLEHDEKLLVLVDQFEELFRYQQAAATTEDDAAAFVKLLLEAVGQSAVPIYVILTMRSDYLGDCTRFRDLPEAISDGQYLIPRLRRDQLREAITGPAAVGGTEVSGRLLQQVLGEVGDEPDQLPILQHALMRTWDLWYEQAGGGPLDLPHYDAVGGMAEALSRHADEAYKSLPDARSRWIAERLFKRLTERGSDGREVRRPTRLAEICDVAEAELDEVVRVIDVFRQPGRSFLTPPAGAVLTPDAMIDISHESLMRVWGRLSQWVDEEAESAQRYRRLAESAALHEEAKARLMQDPELSLTLGWKLQSSPNVHWARRYASGFERVMSFLADSLEARDREALEKEQRRQRELKRTRIFAAILAVLFSRRRGPRIPGVASKSAGPGLVGEELLVQCRQGQEGRRWSTLVAFLRALRGERAAAVFCQDRSSEHPDGEPEATPGVASSA